MDPDSEDKRELITRLACCAVVGAGLYYILDRFWDKLPTQPPPQWRTWLRENKLPAIAAAAAVLFVLSAAVLPLAQQEEHAPPRNAGSCPAP